MTYTFVVNTNTSIGIIKYVHTRTYTLHITDCISKAIQLICKYCKEILI